MGEWVGEVELEVEAGWGGFFFFQGFDVVCVIGMSDVVSQKNLLFNAWISAIFPFVTDELKDGRRGLFKS